MLLLWYSSSLLAEGVTGSEGGTSPKAGFESTGPLSEQHLSAGSRRKGGEIFSSRKYNFRSEMGWSCFGDAGMGRQRPLGSHFFYPLFWGAREGRKSKKRGQKKGKRRILYNGVHSLSNEEIHRMLSLGPWWCPAPISDRSSLCFRQFHLGRFYSPVSCLSDGKCDICHVACSRNSPECVHSLVWAPGLISAPPAQVTFFLWGFVVFLTHWIWELEGLLWFMDAHHFKVIFSLYGLGETCSHLWEQRGHFSWCSTILHLIWMLSIISFANLKQKPLRCPYKSTDGRSLILKRKHVKFFSTLILMCRPLIFLFIFKEVISFLRMRQGWTLSVLPLSSDLSSPLPLAFKEL